VLESFTRLLNPEGTKIFGAATNKITTKIHQDPYSSACPEYLHSFGHGRLWFDQIINACNARTREYSLYIKRFGPPDPNRQRLVLASALRMNTAAPRASQC